MQSLQCPNSNDNRSCGSDKRPISLQRAIQALLWVDALESLDSPFATYKEVAMHLSHCLSCIRIEMSLIHKVYFDIGLMIWYF